jgi:hypothetical protein
MTQDHLCRKSSETHVDCAKYGQKGTRTTPGSDAGSQHSRGGARALPKLTDGRCTHAARMSSAKKRTRSTTEQRAADGRDVHRHPKSQHTYEQHRRSQRSRGGARALPKLTDGRCTHSARMYEASKKPNNTTKQYKGGFRETPTEGSTRF